MNIKLCWQKNAIEASTTGQRTLFIAAIVSFFALNKNVFCIFHQTLTLVHLAKKLISIFLISYLIYSLLSEDISMFIKNELNCLVSIWLWIPVHCCRWFTCWFPAVRIFEAGRDNRLPAGPPWWPPVTQTSEVKLQTRRDDFTELWFHRCSVGMAVRVSHRHLPLDYM